MKILQKIWDDIRQGENIDLYIVVLLSIVLTVIDLSGAASTQNWIEPVTVTILGLLAISMLGNRRRVDDLRESLSDKAGIKFLEKFPDTFQHDMVQATEVWMVGVTFSRTVKTYYTLLESKLKQGHHIRMLLVDPNSSAVESAARRIYVPTTTEQKTQQIKDSLTTLCTLPRENEGTLEIKVIDSPLTIGIRAFDPESANGRIYIEHFSYKQDDSKPYFVLNAHDGTWYRNYLGELYRLWEDAKEWDC